MAVAAGRRGYRDPEASDFAPDASIFPEAHDPRTGGRRIEEVAFEVSDKQSIGVPTKKARELAARGVRRVFCLLVRPRRLLEWSRRIDGWETLPEDAVIEDPVLVRPLPAKALLGAAAADDAVARALIAKRTPAIEEANAEREARGEARGEMTARRQAIVAVLRERGFTVGRTAASRIEACTDPALLDGWHRQAVTAESVSAALRRPVARA